MKKILLCAVLLLTACGSSDPNPKSSSGISKATTTIRTGSDGLTVEQRNIKDRLISDNTPGSIKHLYVISAYSGQVLIYSTVRGKVTSGSKRLTPSTVVENEHHNGFNISIGGGTHKTEEVLGDDGAYGGSSDYLFWFDSKGVYHQHYVQGGQILHVSDQPLAVKSIVLNMELSRAETEALAEEPKE